MRRLFVLLLALSAGSSCGVERERLDLVLVTLDTTRADRLSAYEYGRVTSPRLDELAAEGARFDLALSQAAVTPVAHASILTGQLPYTHGLRVMHGVSENTLPPGAVTLPELLREDGWTTGAFVSAFPVTAEFGFDQGFETFDASFLPRKTDRLVTRQGVVNTGNVQRGAAETVDLALEWLATVESPFFVWLHFFDPHDPLLLPPDEFLAQYEPLPTDERDRLRALYDVEIEYMDRELGRFWDALRARGSWDRTVVCVTADHGEGLGDHDWWTHGVLYQEQIRVPLVLRGPGVPAGLVVDDLVRTMDLAPTLLDLAGQAAGERPRMDGVSLVPLLRGEPLELEYAYAESVNRLTYGFSPTIQDKKDEVLFTLCDGRWKYTHHLTDRPSSELYDLATDPAEQANLHAQRPDVVERLLAELKRRPFLPSRQLMDGGADPENVELLRALGYSGD